MFGGQGYELVDGPRHSKRSSSKARKVPQIPCLNRATSSALQPVSSACWTLCLNAAGLCSFPGLTAKLSGWVVLGALLSSGRSCDFAPSPGGMIGPAPNRLPLFQIRPSGQEGWGATPRSA